MEESVRIMGQDKFFFANFVSVYAPAVYVAGRICRFGAMKKMLENI